MTTDIAPRRLWPAILLDIIGTLIQSKCWGDIDNTIKPAVFIGNDFFGVNIAPGPDADYDTYIVEQLQALNITHVRMHYSYCAINADAQRLLDCVLEQGFTVLLNLTPPQQEAAQLHHDQASQHRWRSFVAETFNHYHQKVMAFEIGATPNRGKWSGFDTFDYLSAWKIACEQAEPYAIKLAGANVSDFEPLYNIGFLSAMKRIYSVPSIHTDNLFVERVIQPELYDHRILGHWFGNKLKFDLIKKARTITAFGKAAGCIENYCSYNCWTRKRLSRWSNNPDQKGANYLIRYLVLAAASDSLNRVYWGPLIDSRDGLIDCGAEDYPDIDNISFYQRIRGQKTDFRMTDMYTAFQTIISTLSDARCVQGICADNGINHFVFTHRDGSETHINWCLDRYEIRTELIYPTASLEQARFSNSSGESTGQYAECITEQPLFIHWPNEQSSYRPNIQHIKKLPAIGHDNIIYPTNENQYYSPVTTDSWRGVIAIGHDHSIAETLAALQPDALEKLQPSKTIRDSARRNRLWNVRHPLNEKQCLTIKLNRVNSAIKKISYRFRDSKGKRHWNNGAEMQRRGVNTPQPIAFFERHENSGIQASYYLCEYIEQAFSARDIFHQFNQGATEVKGHSKSDLIDQITAFIFNMHQQNIVHRDLSGGNLLITQQQDNTLAMYLIDIGRAYISYRQALPEYQRYIDLMRISYKLGWPDRELFIKRYYRHWGQRPPRWWKLPLSYYDYKQSFKKTIKAKLKAKR